VRQLIYRCSKRLTFKGTVPAGEVVILTNPFVAVLRLWSLTRWRNPMWAAQVMAKLGTRKRQLLLFVDKGKIQHIEWLTYGSCVHYKIQKRDAVIGPIETSRKARGKGVATYCLVQAVNHLKDAGVERVYIDTAHDNVACQMALKKAGYGPPISSYVRPESGLE
jgi:RimJ/RimL family protein N-acetyltransferase